MKLIACLLVLCSLTVSACEARTLNVVASFTVLADVIRQVGGDGVNVKSLVPPNGDPHEFEPSPDDAKALKSADLAIISGDGLETWFARLAKAAGYKGAPVVASDGIETLQAVLDGKRQTDPHVWNNPLNVVRWANNIAAALAAADPEDKARFATNAEHYIAQLKDADAYAHAHIDSIPTARRKILTSHDAFNYFGKAYSVEFIAPVGYSSETEPSAATVAKIIGQVRKNDVKVYFFARPAYYAGLSVDCPKDICVSLKNNLYALFSLNQAPVSFPYHTACLRRDMKSSIWCSAALTRTGFAGWMGAFNRSLSAAET